MPLQNALFLFITDIYIRGWTLAMTKKLKKIVISKDKAVFWLNQNGRWCNRHGEFEHKKIIDYFNASIRKDKGGYYVAQTTDDYQEKVYFHYEDTARARSKLCIRIAS